MGDKLEINLTMNDENYLIGLIDSIESEMNTIKDDLARTQSVFAVVKYRLDELLWLDRII
jgi:hypothetical protein